MLIEKVKKLLSIVTRSGEKSSENEIQPTGKNRLARFLDYYGARICVFLLVAILLLQFNFSSNQAVIIALMTTVVFHFYLKRLRRMQLTKIAQKRLLLIMGLTQTSNVGNNRIRSGLEKIELITRYIPVHGIRSLFFSGLFLICFSLFYADLWRLYFLVFGGLNLILAVLACLKIKQNKSEDTLNSSPKVIEEVENSCEKLVPPVK